MKGVSAVIATILMLLITIALAGMAYMYISGLVGPRTRSLALVDAWCSSGEVSALIRNDGASSVTTDEQTFVSVDESCTEPSKALITASNTTTYKFTSCGTTARYQKWKLIGPGNTVDISVYCSGS